MTEANYYYLGIKTNGNLEFFGYCGHLIEISQEMLAEWGKPKVCLVCFQKEEGIE